MAIDKVVDSTILDGYFEDIANAIRAKDGSQATLAPAAMPQAIANIPTGGGGDTLADVLLAKTATEYINNTFTGTVGQYMFYNATSLQTLKLPGVTSCGEYAFSSCSGLTTIDFSSLTSTGNSAFIWSFEQTAEIEITFPELLTAGGSCFSNAKMKSINLPKLTTMSPNILYACNKLQSATFGSDLTDVQGMAYCNALQRVVFGGNVGTVKSSAFYRSTSCLLYDFSNCIAVPSLENVNAFERINANAQIVVPDSLYSTWIAATNWTTLSSYIVKESDYVAA